MKTLAEKIEALRNKVLAEKLPIASEKLYFESRLVKIEILRGQGKEFFAVYRVESVDVNGAENLQLCAMISSGLIKSSMLAEITKSTIWQ